MWPGLGHLLVCPYLLHLKTESEFPVPSRALAFTKSWGKITWAAPELEKIVIMQKSQTGSASHSPKEAVSAERVFPLAVTQPWDLSNQEHAGESGWGNAPRWQVPPSLRLQKGLGSSVAHLSRSRVGVLQRLSRCNLPWPWESRKGSGRRKKPRNGECAAGCREGGGAGLNRLKPAVAGLASPCHPRV